MLFVTDLTGYMYCSRKLYFSKILHIREKPQEQSIKGTIKHAVFEHAGKQDKEIIITLSKLFEVTRIIFDSKKISDCTSPKGQVEVIENGKTWKKLTESFPAIQMDKPYTKNNFSYYFLADKISSIKFVFDSYSSCALEDSNLTIYALE